MRNFIPKAGEIKTRGLGPKAQSGDKSFATSSTASIKAKDSFPGSKKTTFQRKAV